MALAHLSHRQRHVGLVLTAVALAVLVGVAAGGAVYMTRSSRSGGSPQTAGASEPANGALSVVRTDPAPNATNVPSSSAITVSLTVPLAAHSPMPSFSPPISGKWSSPSSHELQFVSSGPLVPSQSETLTIPGGPTGLKSAQGKYLASTTTVPFTVAAGSTLRLQQLLAQLNYLPLSFAPSGPAPSPQQGADPQQGTFNWKYPEPASLTSLWTEGSSNVITTGAVMNFESLHNMTPDGNASAQVWSALLQAAATGAGNPNTYNYVFVNQALPETVTVYQNGQQVYQTPANTGVAASPTAPGTFPVYERFTSTTMSGTNPDGSYYSDPGVPWVSYFNGGDALHGFVRPGYGYPQSDGCVEMPIANAQVVFPLTPIGTLVTVST